MLGCRHARLPKGPEGTKMAPTGGKGEFLIVLVYLSLCRPLKMAVAMLAISRIVSMDIASEMSKSGGACRSLCAINCPAPTYARQTPRGSTQRTHPAGWSGLCCREVVTVASRREC